MRLWTQPGDSHGMEGANPMDMNCVVVVYKATAAETYPSIAPCRSRKRSLPLPEAPRNRIDSTLLRRSSFKSSKNMVLILEPKMSCPLCSTWALYSGVHAAPSSRRQSSGQTDSLSSRSKARVEGERHQCALASEQVTA